MTTSTVIILILAICVIVLAGVMMIQRRKTHDLKTKFGPEYDRVVATEGSPRRAEAVLDSRQKRVKTYNIRRLTREECNRFAQQWHVAQEDFVDDPHGAVAEADRLINEALQAQGYPMGDFEQQAADISVEHPRVVEDYRAAHAIALRDQRATTEELRSAMQRYRNLFEHVLDTRVTEIKAEYEDVRR